MVSLACTPVRARMAPSPITRKNSEEADTIVKFTTRYGITYKNLGYKPAWHSFWYL